MYAQTLTLIDTLTASWQNRIFFFNCHETIHRWLRLDWIFYCFSKYTLCPSRYFLFSTKCKRKQQNKTENGKRSFDLRQRKARISFKLIFFFFFFFVGRRSSSEFSFSLLCTFTIDIVSYFYLRTDATDFRSKSHWIKKRRRWGKQQWRHQCVPSETLNSLLLLLIDVIVRLVPHSFRIGQSRTTSEISSILFFHFGLSVVVGSIFSVFVFATFSPDAVEFEMTLSQWRLDTIINATCTIRWDKV